MTPYLIYYSAVRLFPIKNWEHWPLHNVSDQTFSGFHQKLFLITCCHTRSGFPWQSAYLCLHVSFLHSLSQIRLQRPVTERCPLLPVCFGSYASECVAQAAAEHLNNRTSPVHALLPVLPSQNQFCSQQRLASGFTILVWVPVVLVGFPARGMHMFTHSPSTGCYFKTPSVARLLLSLSWLQFNFDYVLLSFRWNCLCMAICDKFLIEGRGTLFLRQGNTSGQGVSCWLH